MRILYHHHRPEKGGSPTSLLLLLKEMAKRPDVVLRVLCPAGPASHLFREEGFDVHEIPVSNFYHVLGSEYERLRWLLFVKELCSLPRHLFAVYREVKSFRPDIVHLNEVSLVGAAWLLKRMRIKVIWHCRAPIADGHSGVRKRMVRQYLRKFADRVIAIDADVADGIGSVANPEVIHNSVAKFPVLNALSRRDARSRLGLPPGGFIVSMVCRLHKIKGSYDFIEAARLVRDRGEKALFLAVGGALRPAAFFRSWKGIMYRGLGLVEDHESHVRTLITKYKLEDVVRLYDYRSDVLDFYLASDVVVFPSYCRGPNRSWLEAAALGLPVVATTVSWNSDVIVHGKTGLLVPQGDVAAFSEAVMRLLRDARLRLEMGQAARVHAETTFDPVRNAEKVYAIYQRVLRPAGQGAP